MQRGDDNGIKVEKATSNNFAGRKRAFNALPLFSVLGMSFSLGCLVSHGQLASVFNFNTREEMAAATADRRMMASTTTNTNQTQDQTQMDIDSMTAQIAAHKNRTEGGKCRYIPQITSPSNARTDPYPQIPTDEYLAHCKYQIPKHFQYNNLQKSPLQYRKRLSTTITFKYDSLVKSTQCAINPILYEQQLRHMLPQQQQQERQQLQQQQEQQQRQQQEQEEDCFPKKYFTEIARIPAPKTFQEFHKKIALRALPVILTDYEPQSQLWAWTLDDIAERAGNFSMMVRHGNYDTESGRREGTRMSVKQYVDMVRGITPRPAGLPPYLGNNVLSRDLAKTLGYAPPKYYERSTYVGPALWIGPQGTETPAHKDGPDNFAFMIRGTKRWTIFPPDDIEILDCTRCSLDESVDPALGGHLRNGLCWCPQDVIREGELLPWNTQPHTFDLRAGEILYLPGGWIHSVQNLDETVMINQWFKSGMVPKSVWGPELIHFWASHKNMAP